MASLHLGDSESADFPLGLLSIPLGSGRNTSLLLANMEVQAYHVVSTGTEMAAGFTTTGKGCKSPRVLVDFSGMMQAVGWGHLIIAREEWSLDSLLSLCRHR